MNLDTNSPSDREVLKAAAKRPAREIREQDPLQNRMATVGTTPLVTIMNDFDLPPAHKYRFGSHPQAPNLGEENYGKLKDAVYKRLS